MAFCKASAAPVTCKQNSEKHHLPIGGNSCIRGLDAEAIKLAEVLLLKARVGKLPLQWW